ncbi:MAG: hypothetical protein CL451_02115 [Acidimicrobiaceae bacterium]|nr:hypothetical protein [Acidimicrobiaceae bacterium]MCH2627375.1 hypothetical protein [Acidimicrobiales bacterium]
MEQDHGLLKVNPVGSLGPGDRLLVLLHGFGADENDLAPLVQHIDPDGRFTSICFRAPIDLVPFGAAWYERDDAGVVDSATFRTSVQAIDRTIDAVCEAGSFQRSEMVIIGFSQGCAMTLAVSLSKDTDIRPAAMACLSGMLQEIPDFEYDLTQVPDTLIQHGTLDPMVDIERGRRIRDVLIDSGCEPDYAEYPMGHEISNASLFDLRDWLAAV